MKLNLQVNFSFVCLIVLFIVLLLVKTFLFSVLKFLKTFLQNVHDWLFDVAEEEFHTRDTEIKTNLHLAGNKAHALNKHLSTSYVFYIDDCCLVWSH